MIPSRQNHGFSSLPWPPNSVTCCIVPSSISTLSPTQFYFLKFPWPHFRLSCPIRCPLYKPDLTATSFFIPSIWCCPIDALKVQLCSRHFSALKCLLTLCSQKLSSKSKSRLCNLSFSAPFVSLALSPATSPQPPHMRSTIQTGQLALPLTHSGICLLYAFVLTILSAQRAFSYFTCENDTRVSRSSSVSTSTIIPHWVPDFALNILVINISQACKITTEWKFTLVLAWTFWNVG